MGKVVEAGTIEWSCQQLTRQPIQAFDSQGIATQRNRLSKSQLKSANTRPHQNGNGQRRQQYHY